MHFSRGICYFYFRIYQILNKIKKRCQSGDVRQKDLNALTDLDELVNITNCKETSLLTNIRCVLSMSLLPNKEKQFQ